MTRLALVPALLSSVSVGLHGSCSMTLVAVVPTKFIPALC